MSETNNSNEVVVSIKNLQKAFGDNVVLRDIDLDVHKGEVVWSQADISRFGGVAAVESLRKGNVSPIGVARSGSAGSSAGKSSGTSTPTPLTVNLIENPSKAGQVERGRNSDGSESLTLFAAQIRAGGNEASDTFESVYGLKRSPG